MNIKIADFGFSNEFVPGKKFVSYKGANLTTSYNIKHLKQTI